MKNVIFYFEPDWAFGTIHYELFKHLWAEGYNCQLLPWNRAYTVEELRELDQQTDLWVSNPHGYRHLVHVFKSVAPDRCVMVSHAASDIHELIDHHGLAEFNNCKKYGVVSEFLKTYGQGVGVTRTPMICPIGINYHTFKAEPNAGLTSIGYAGKYNERLIGNEEEGYHTHITRLKRSYLVREVAERVGLRFVVANHYHNSFVTMPGFYKSVDCIMVSSTNEGAGLPVLEAGAAGKLVISTEVGHWHDRVAPLGGITAPMDENEYIDSCVEILTYYKNRPEEYRARCYQIQEHAKEYDWSNYLGNWIELLSD